MLLSPEEHGPSEQIKEKMNQPEHGERASRPAQANPQGVSLHEVAQASGLPMRQIHWVIQQGLLPVSEIVTSRGREYTISAQDLTTFLLSYTRIDLLRFLPASQRALPESSSVFPAPRRSSVAPPAPRTGRSWPLPGFELFIIALFVLFLFLLILLGVHEYSLYQTTGTTTQRSLSLYNNTHTVTPVVTLSARFIEHLLHRAVAILKR